MNDRLTSFFAVLLCLCFGACTWAVAKAKPAVPGTARPIMQKGPPPSPVGLSFSRRLNRSVTVQFATARPGLSTVVLRSALSQSVSSATIDTSVFGGTGARVTLPTPWRGELKITSPAKTEGRTESVFVSVVIEPVSPEAPGGVPRILRGPSGRSSVLFSKTNSPSSSTSICFTSPANAAAPPPVNLEGDLLDIGFVPPLRRPTKAFISMTAWSPHPDSRLAVHVFDPVTRKWSALRSRHGRDGAVSATGPMPGLYALAAPQ